MIPNPATLLPTFRFRPFAARGAALALCLLLATLAATAQAAPITIPTVPVGNPGNAPDENLFGIEPGAVNYNFRIGAYEVTNAEYAAFLNEKARLAGAGANTLDPLGLYHVQMGQWENGGISRAGGGTDLVSDPYVYTVKPNLGNRPIIYVSWYDAIRFANWLHNGQAAGDTETGAYTLGELDDFGVPIDGAAITRNAGAKWFLPSHDEWYKAAYHKNDGPTGNYWEYPTGSDTMPTAEPPPGGANSANYGMSVESGFTDVGAYVDSPSPYGTYDQGGNVKEWNETSLPWDFPERRGFRGGSWIYAGNSLAAGTWYFGDPTVEEFEHGFRVATIPEPSTAALALLGCALACTLRRRFKVVALSHAPRP